MYENFKYDEVVSNRLYYNEYKLISTKVNEKTILKIVGIGTANKKEELYSNNSKLYEDVLKLGENMTNDDLRLDLQDIPSHILNFVKKYGISINEEDNEIYNICSKSYNLYKLSNIKMKNYIDVPSTFKSQSTKFVDISVKANGINLINPVKEILKFNETNEYFEIHFYSSSLLSIATHMYMHKLLKKDAIMNKCKYCNKYFSKNDLRCNNCGSEECLRKAKNEISRKYRQKDKQRTNRLNELYTKISSTLTGKEKEEFENDYAEKITKISQREFTKEKLIQYLEENYLSKFI